MMVRAHTSCSSAHTANIALTCRNWLIGAYIYEYELQGQDRAEYGEQLMQRLADALRKQGVPACERPRLYAYLSFYRVYPQIREAVLEEWTSKGTSISATDEIFRSLTGKTTPTEATGTIVRSATGISPASGTLLVERLSYTHLELLAGIDDPLKRAFYEAESIKGNWSMRELKRQMASLYFERSGLSRDKPRLSEIANAVATKSEPKDVIRDPYVFEFLGLRPQEVMPESDLEAALIEKLQGFLLELGYGFCFEARQKRLLIGGEAFFVDLVFYHRILKCHVLVELKVDEFRHEHLGQVNTYVSYYRAHEMTEGDQPPIGILLCTGKNHALVEYALAGMDNRLFVSKYQLELPKPEELRRYIEKQRRLMAGGEK
jgi:predicted nuclease of restriction endonuclease-like (RecB) superfamily